MSTDKLPPGTLFAERYRIGKAMGEGGTATVYEAVDELWRQEVVVKVLSTELGSEPEARERFQREAELTVAVRHERLVRAFSHGLAPGAQPFIVLERLVGEDLGQRMTSGATMAPAVAIELVAQVASALDVLHRAGIVHRDVKPENIFITSDGRDEAIKLIDLGASRLQTSRMQLTAAGMTIGTPQYMSPEQATGQSERIDGRCDQFALAAVAFELLTGSSPFPGRSLGESTALLLTAPPVSFASIGATVGEGIERVLHKALQKSPELRYATCGTFAAALREAAIGAGHIAQPGVLRFRLSPVRARRRGMMLVGGSLVAVGILAVVAALHLGVR